MHNPKSKTPISMEKFPVLYSDPPWQFDNKRSGGSLKSGAAQKYDVMSFSDLCAMPIQNIAAEDCVLFMWWVASMPAEALAVVNAWGFTLKTMTGFTWIKTTSNNKMDFGMGFWTRAGAECCLVATKGKPKRVSASVRSVFEFEDQTFYATKTAHSVKPDVVRHKIVQLMGDVPRLEMFARGVASPGWSVFGNEVENSLQL